MHVSFFISSRGRWALGPGPCAHGTGTLGPWDRDVGHLGPGPRGSRAQAEFWTDWVNDIPYWCQRHKRSLELPAEGAASALCT